MPCGTVSPLSSTDWRGGRAGWAFGASSTTVPACVLTSSAPWGVQVIHRAEGTSAQTTTFQPGGTVSVSGTANPPTPFPAGTRSVVRTRCRDSGMLAS
jgi:hypothetical protein